MVGCPHSAFVGYSDNTTETQTVGPPQSTWVRVSITLPVGKEAADQVHSYTGNILLSDYRNPTRNMDYYFHKVLCIIQTLYRYCMTSTAI